MTEQSTETQSTEQNDVLPDWAREKLTKANNEAAKYRNEKNDAVEAAKNEVAESYTSKVEALEAQIAERDAEASTARVEVDRLKATIEAGIDHDKVYTFAELLKGDTAEELKSHADQLKELFITEEAPKTKSPATDPSQGSAGKTLPLNGDPLLAAVTKAINR